MNPLDATKTILMTNSSNYYYEVIPFGLKNADTIYQRLIDALLIYQIWRNLEVYIDDMVVKIPYEKIITKTLNI